MRNRFSGFKPDDAAGGLRRGVLAEEEEENKRKVRFLEVGLVVLLPLVMIGAA